MTTPRPWKVAGRKERRIEGPGCQPVIEDGWTPSEADAALIVAAVNTFDAAREALEDALMYLRTHGAEQEILGAEYLVKIEAVLATMNGGAK